MINNTKDIKEYCYASENEEIGFNFNRGNKLYKVVIEYNLEDDDYREEDDDYYDYPLMKMIKNLKFLEMTDIIWKKILT